MELIQVKDKGHFPVVSVVIPFYNRGGWLTEAVESVLGQTFSDYEIVVVDDGSTDMPEILQHRVDPRIRYFRQENSGPSAARNRGISLARGKFIAFLDADDLFQPDKLDKQLTIMNNNPDCPMSHTSYLSFKLDGEFTEEVPSGTFSGNVYPSIIMGCPIATPTVMVLKEVMEEFKFKEDFRYGEDIILWTEIARNYRILGIEAPLTKIRKHGFNAADNPHLQYSEGLRVLRYNIGKDPELSLPFKLRALAQVNKNAGSLFLEHRKKLESFKYILRGIYYWPFTLHGYFLLISALIPEFLRPRLRRIKNGALDFAGLKGRGNRSKSSGQEARPRPE